MIRAGRRCGSLAFSQSVHAGGAAAPASAPCVSLSVSNTPVDQQRRPSGQVASSIRPAARDRSLPSVTAHPMIALAATNAARRLTAQSPRREVAGGVTGQWQVPAAWRDPLLPAQQTHSAGEDCQNREHLACAESSVRDECDRRGQQASGALPVRSLGLNR